MERWQVIGLLAAGIVLLLISVLVRGRFGEQYELKTVDLVLIIMPLLFVLLVSGKLKVLDAFGVKADFSELFSTAAGAGIEKQVALKVAPNVDDVVRMLEMAAKGGVQEIPRLIENKTEALVFRLGHGGYYGPAIKQYFDALYASSYLKYILVMDEQKKLFCIYDALDIAVYFRTERERAYEEFAHWLNRPDADSRKALGRLPGFIGADQAVERTRTKREVLKLMETAQVNTLPVVDQDGVFIGTVERSQLTASLILEVADRLEGKNKAAASE